MDLRIVIADENGDVLRRINVYQDGSDRAGAFKIETLLADKFTLDIEFSIQDYLNNAETPPPDLKVTAHPSKKKIKLTWTPVGPQKDFSYIVYRADPGQPPAQIGTTNKSNFSDTDVVSGTTYLYFVSVVDSNNIESSPHGPVTATAK